MTRILSGYYAILVSQSSLIGVVISVQRLTHKPYTNSTKTMTEFSSETAFKLCKPFHLTCFSFMSAENANIYRFLNGPGSGNRTRLSWLFVYYCASVTIQKVKPCQTHPYLPTCLLSGTKHGTPIAVYDSTFKDVRFKSNIVVKNPE